MNNIVHSEDYYLNQTLSSIVHLMNHHDMPLLFSYRTRQNVQIHMGTNRVKEEFENDYQTDPKWKILFNTDADDQRRLVNRPYININANGNPRADSKYQDFLIHSKDLLLKRKVIL